ncbi:MAG TPA: ABC transporter substrate-binding protein, partial [Chitinophagaceae bacterium]|nr:ABC transporter substrate-binding protein [Chitinophagaceae bacterium]
MQHQLIHQRCSWWLLCICCCWLGCTNAHRKDPNVFYYNESSGIATLDPAFAKNQSIMWVLHQVYRTLVNINSKLEVVPAVAKRWEVDATGTRYKFYLRDDVYFIDNPCFPQGKGRKLIANDVVYSLQRIMLPATASSGAWIFNNRVVNDGFHAINDTTFELVLAKPFPP